MQPATQTRVEELRYICHLVKSDTLVEPWTPADARHAVFFGCQEIETRIKIDSCHLTAKYKWQTMKQHLETLRLRREIPFLSRRTVAEECLAIDRKPDGPIVRCPAKAAAVFAVMDWVDIDRILDTERIDSIKQFQMPGMAAFVLPPTTDAK